MRKVILAFLLIAGWAGAQQPESLLIGPGDLLHVQVFDTPELEQKDARVTDAGELPLILGGNVKVAPLTPAEAARAIEKALLDGHFLLRPRVTVTVEEYATQKVSVLGEVKTPGAYAISTPRSVLDVLSLGQRRPLWLGRSQQRIEAACANEAGKLVAAASDNLASRQITVTSPGVATAANAIIKASSSGLASAVKATGLTPELAASLIVGKIGELQAQMTSAGAKP